MQQQVRVVGWFRRSVSQLVDLKSMQTQSGELVKSWTSFWGKCGGILVLLIGLVVGAVGAFAAASETDTSPARSTTSPAAVAPAAKPQPVSPPTPTIQAPAVAPKPAAPAARPKTNAAPAQKAR